MDDDCLANLVKNLNNCVNEIHEIYNYYYHQKAIFFLDGHCSRNNRQIMALFKTENIRVIIFTSHITHLIQPFDRIIARHLKDALTWLASYLIDEIDKENQEKVVYDISK